MKRHHSRDTKAWRRAEWMLRDYAKQICFSHCASWLAEAAADYAIERVREHELWDTARAEVRAYIEARQRAGHGVGWDGSALAAGLAAGVSAAEPRDGARSYRSDVARVAAKSPAHQSGEEPSCPIERVG